MMGQKDGLGQVTAQMARKENSVGHLAGSRKEANVSQRWQTQPSIGGYIAEGSTWSQNHDSAASMFPLVPGWEEDYQDLSAYCRKTEHNMSCGKEVGIKISSCTVPDDELNTPEICIPEFDYPAHGNVLSKDNTSPVSLFDGGMWDPSVDTTQKVGDITPAQFKLDDKYIETSNVTVSDPKETEVINEIWIPTLDHEEEIDSSNENIIMLQDSVNQHVETDMTLPDNIIEVEVLVNQTNHESMTETTDNQDEVMESNVEANLKYLESLLMAVKTQPSDNDIVTDQIKLETDTCMEIEPQLSCEQPVGVRTDGLTAAPSVEKPLKDKSHLSLNLAEVLATDDLISTPVILESLLGEVVSFDKLLEFVQADNQELKTANAPVASTVDFSAISSSSSCSSSSTSSHHEDLMIIPEPSVTTDRTLNVEIVKPERRIVKPEIVKPVVIKKSPTGQLSVSQKQDSNYKSENVNKVKGHGRKRIIIKKTTKKIPILETGSVLTANVVNKQTSKQISEKKLSVPKPRGRPSREPTPSTSREYETRPKRQRKVTESSDYDYDISSPPASKRSRLSSIESESGKYRELRDRNNEASRKSRLNRKCRESEMQETAEKLEKENQSLRIKAEEMDRLVKKLREALLEAVTKGKKKEDQ